MRMLPSAPDARDESYGQVAQAARKDGARPLLGKVSSVIVNPAPVQEGGAA